MSVLIKGMSMPRNCLYCRFCVDNVDNKERMCTVCTALNKDFDNGIIDYEDRRRDDCPLIELPPHGDLIDRDTILYGSNRLIQNYYGDVFGRRNYATDDEIRQAPAIIEADMDSCIRIFEGDDEEDGMDSFIRILKD